MKHCLAAISLVFTMVCASAQSTDTLKHVESWQQLLSDARQHNKLIFVDCYFTGCHPCAQMDKDVFPTELVQKQFTEKYLAVKVDVFKEKLGDSLNRKYAITGYPTYLILNAEGKLLNRFSGYKDAGLLLAEMKQAEEMQVSGKSLEGFSASIGLTYPDFYNKFYDRSGEPLPANVAIDWLTKQSDFSKETAAMPLILTRKLTPALEQKVLSEYTMLRTRFGKELLVGKASGLLNAAMKTAVGNQKNEPAFRDFLKQRSSAFPAADWNILRMLAGMDYYGSIAKDTLGLLRFLNEEPLIYQNYVGSLYNTMIVRNQMTPEYLALFCNWSDKAVLPTSAIDAMYAAAYMHKKNGNQQGFERFLRMAIQRAKDTGMNAANYEKALAIK